MHVEQDGVAGYSVEEAFDTGFQNTLRVGLTCVLSMISELQRLWGVVPIRAEVILHDSWLASMFEPSSPHLLSIGKAFS